MAALAFSVRSRLPFAPRFMLRDNLSQSSAHRVPAGATHLVQFYDREEFLTATVTDYIAAGLRSGEPAIVIATPEHRRAFEARLGASARVTFLDAATLIARFMNGPAVDDERFLTTIGALLEETSGGTSRVRAYGEMVSLLWRDGHPEAAVRVEELWNELATLYPFSLLCAYPLDVFSSESDPRLFAHVCGAHAKVFPAETYNRSADDDTRLRQVAELQQRAAALAAENTRLQELAQHANRTRDEFLATLSHELRTPLTAILGWSKMLLLGSLDADTSRTALETIERSAKCQASLIDDLLDLNRVITGCLSLQSEPVDLRDAVARAVETVRLAASARAIVVRAGYPQEPCIVTGDAARLQQLAWNLVSNAVKFSWPGGEVVVAVERDGDSVRLTVRDAGRGIVPEFLPYVFEPLRQGDGASTRSHNGLGLGLAMVKYLTELHGGTVSAASDGHGAGATFTVILPLAGR